MASSKYQDTEELRKTSKHGIDLLLIGKSGHGKSATGNSILGKDAFAVRGGAESISHFDFKVDSVEVDGCFIRVMDFLGLDFNEIESEKERVGNIIGTINQGIEQFPNGFSALLLVLSYSQRYTHEDADVIKNIKAIFGENVIRDHTVLVFTRGECYDKDSDSDFKTWCKSERQSQMRKLLEECSFRCVIFNNITKDKKTKTLQRKELLSQVSEISSRPYSFQEFQDSEGNRQNIIIGITVAAKIDDYNREIDALTLELNNLKKDKFRHIDELKQRICRLNKELNAAQSKDLSFTKNNLKLVKTDLDMYEQSQHRAESEAAENKNLEKRMEMEKEQTSRNYENTRNNYSGCSLS